MIAVFSNRVFGVFGLTLCMVNFFLVVDVFPMVQRIHNHELPVNDGDKGVEDGRDVASHVVTQLHRYLSSSPGGVVAHADVLRVQVAGQDRHELCGDDND